eukprot:5003093-Prymnesium_polylepis.1
MGDTSTRHAALRRPATTEKSASFCISTRAGRRSGAERCASLRSARAMRATSTCCRSRGRSSSCGHRRSSMRCWRRCVRGGASSAGSVRARATDR